MGLAAAYSVFDIHFQRRDFFLCFKDNIQRTNDRLQGAAIATTFSNLAESFTDSFADEFADEFRLQAEIE